MYNKIYFDLSVLSYTSAGSAVFAWEICHRLMRIANPLQVVPIRSPFVTLNKKGLSRISNAFLRDLVWNKFLIHNNEADYYIFPNMEIPPLFFDRKKKIKYAVVILDLGAWHNREIMNWRGRYSLNNLPQMIRNADNIFTISDYTAHDVSNEFNIPIERMIITPCGLSKAYQKISPRINYINEIPLPQKYFLHVGSFEPKKNVPFLIHVYEKYRIKTINEKDYARMVFTGGESWKHEEIIKAINNSKFKQDIIILGKVQSDLLPSLYSGASAFIFPSTFEGFGIPVIEALSQGAPVLANNNTSLSQFKKYGATIFDNYDEDVWSDYLINITQNNIRVDERYISLIKKVFNWDNSAKIFAETLGI